MDTVYTARLKKGGGSVVLTIPPALRNALALLPDTQVQIAVVKGYLVVVPPGAAISEQDREWINDPPVGKELI